MTDKPRKLWAQLSISMVFTSVTALATFALGMVIFYTYLQVTWINSLNETNRETLITLIENGKVDPDALTTLVSVFSFSWSTGYALKELLALIILVMVTILSSVIIGMIVAKRISRPIEIVTDAAMRVASGRLDLQINNDIKGSLEAHGLLRSFNRMTRSLEQAERETTESAAAIAHELRTPLTILRGRLQGLSDGAFEPSPDMLLALIAQVDTLSHIVDDLSTLSRLSAGHYDPEVILVDLADQTTAVLTSVSPDIKKDGFTLETSLASAKTQADPARIRQALNALIQNARQYAATGKYIRVETYTKDEHAYLRVIDRGPGVPKANRDRVFDRWWRAETSRSRAEGGSGLGLSVVRAIVNAHKGNVTVSENPDGSGAIFTICLPRFFVGR